ncbi:hypothetical protein [Neisseria sp. Ec49-e6-T10]|uniref:hypothetical protein n=1 Tax=Neisseria sp. Ec49-e6-T10 TaxID=3140744 RepID=UPI003EBB6816
MIRNNIYMLYRGEEYRIGKYTKDTVNLISTNAVDEQNGFEHFSIDPNLYRKTISVAEIGDVFSIHTYAIYKGQKCSVEGEDTEHYFLRVEQRSIADKLNFDIRDRDDFVKTVAKQDVEKIFEEKKLKENYFK